MQCTILEKMRHFFRWMYVRPSVLNSRDLKELPTVDSRTGSGLVGQCAAGLRVSDSFAIVSSYPQTSRDESPLIVFSPFLTYCKFRNYLLI